LARHRIFRRCFSSFFVPLSTSSASSRADRDLAAREYEMQRLSESF